MKYILIIPDGIADHPLEALSQKTPLEVSRVPFLDYFAKLGKVGTVRHAQDRVDVAAHMAFFSALGYEPKKHVTGQGPLEAANLEIKLEDNEVAFRMNLVTEANGILADATAGHVTSREAKALVNFLNKKLASDFVRFFAGEGHRHLAVIRDARGFEALSAGCEVPELAVGKPIQSHLPKGVGADLIKKLMYDAKSLLESHEVNQVRVDLKENPANMIWLWGQGRVPKFQKFSEKYEGLTGAIISCSEYAKGFARMIGLTVMELSASKMYPDFDFEGQAQAMLELLKEKDFVCVHTSACAEASSEGNVKQKILSLESLDHHLIRTAKVYYEEMKDVRVLISPLLVTPCQAKAPHRESVPFIVAGKNVMPDENEHFNEPLAQLSRLKLQDGWKLIDYLISGKDPS
jgi:2,3-bisphosphoglycerate-independent phosphoglycerate mutase